jgi:O-antigen ligase
MFLLHSSLCVLFLGMLAALTTSSNLENGGMRFMPAVLGVVMVLSLGNHSLNPAGPGLPGIFTLLIFSEIFAGLPGLIYWQSGDNLLIGLSFAVLLAIRSYIVFWSLPTSRTILHGSFERIVLSWALAATTLFAFGSLMVARSAGISLGSSARLTGEVLGYWTNANTTGLYCAFGILICIIARFVPLWVRLAAGGLCLYCLLLSQSRTAIIAILASGVCSFIVLHRWNWKVTSLGICGLLIALSFVNADESFDLLQSNPTLAAITQRFSEQPNQGGTKVRIDVLETGFEAWSRSPLFGLGYEVPEARFENGYLSLACETGAFGLLVYLFFIALLGMQIQGLLRSPADSATYNLGGYLLCVTVFVLVHGLGERTHGFQIGSLVSNVWALLAASALGCNPTGRSVRYGYGLNRPLSTSHTG